MTRFTETVARPFRAIARATLGDEYRQLRSASVLFREGSRYAPWVWWHDTVQTRLRELNPDALRWLQQMQGWEELGAGGASQQGSEERDRLRAVNRSRWGYDHLILIDRMVNMWTDFAFGQNVNITIKDAHGNPHEEAQRIFDRFWTSRENSYMLAPSQLNRLSNKLLLDGELFWPFFVSVVDGTVQMRSVDTAQITKVITVPGDDVAVVGYERQSTNGATSAATRYYRDWRWEPERLEQALKAAQVGTGQNVLLAARENEATDVAMMHVAWKGQRARGWPQFGNSVWWAHQYQQFLLWRLTLDRAVATLWEDIETQGGSRATNYFNTLLQSAYATGGTDETNPAPPVGTPFVHNEGVTRKRMPLTTGAVDAELDGMSIIAYVGLEGGIPPHWLGRPDALQNRATARELLRPVMRQWARYQLLWTNVWRDVARLVLWAATTYPRQNALQLGCAVDELDIDTTMDTPTDADFADMVTALTAFQDKGILAGQDVTQIAVRLQELGITDQEAAVARRYPPEAAVEAGEMDLSNLTPEQRAIVEAAARQLMRG